jgi:hypothetical protein
MNSPATPSEPTDSESAPPASAQAPTSKKRGKNRSTLLVIGKTIASIRLTVVLFALLIFIVLAGTLAQAEYSNLTAIDQYFRCIFTKVEFKVFFPRGSSLHSTMGDAWFPFPGGWLIGGVMLVNLVSAHAFRFKITGKGQKLWIGVGVTALGIIAAFWAVISVFDVDGTQREMSSYFRILLQLAQGGGAAIILMVGCSLLFKKRAGIVVLHLGIILLMISELLTGAYSVEANLRLTVGQSLNYADEYHVAELAFVSTDDKTRDAVVAINGSKIRDAAEAKEPIEDDRLPATVDVVYYAPNSDLTSEETDKTLDNMATAGRGMKYRVIELSEAIGADSEQAIPMPTAYIRLRDKSGKELGVYLLSYLTYLIDGPETIEIDGKTYQVSLRPKRHYLYTKDSTQPYTIHLDKFVHKKYAGTDRPKDFSSYVTVRDPDRGVERSVRIWMNHPLYYGDKVFYQSSFDPKDPNVTTLQVVKNRNWMVPYVGCMIVVVGMTGHFGITLVTFLRRRLFS